MNENKLNKPYQFYFTMIFRVNSYGVILIPILCVIVVFNVLRTCHYIALILPVTPTLQKKYVEVVPTNILVTNAVTKRSILPTCVGPKHLVGALQINFTEMQTNYDYLTAVYSNNTEKLVFEPALCNPKFAAAIIVPFRDRQQHLEYFLGHLHPVLKIQLSR